MKRITSLLLLVSVLATSVSSAVQVVTEGSIVGCEEIRLNRELKVYKDPSLFVGNLSLIYTDPELGWEKLMEETPLLTSIAGTVHLVRLGPPRAFKNFGAVAKLYELAEPKFRVKKEDGTKVPVVHPMIVPIQICGQGEAYTDSLGFVLQTELEEAQRAVFENGSMPPSGGRNPIPVWRPRG